MFLTPDLVEILSVTGVGLGVDANLDVDDTDETLLVVVVVAEDDDGRARVVPANIPSRATVVVVVHIDATRTILAWAGSARAS